jgi:glycine/D-amino acid oxidase-like deaminating enzyme
LTIDVLVIGAGMIGAACADALAAEGLAVTVIEREAIGSGATAAGMGHLVVMDDNPAELALTAYSVALWRQLVALDPKLHEYSCCGTLWIAADDEELAVAREKQRTLSEHGIACELLDAASLYAHEPQLRPGLRGGLRVGADAVVYPPKSAALLLARAQSRGAKLRSGQVSAVIEGGVLLADGSAIHAGKVLVANGSASLQLLPELPQKRSYRDHRPLSRNDQPSTGRTRLYQKCARGRWRFSGLQPAAAPDGTVVDWLFASVRCYR